MMNMKTNPEQNESRRAFLKNILRTLLLGGVVSIGGFLGWRTIRSAEKGTACVITTPCWNCPKYADCPNPNSGKSKQKIGSQ